MACHGKSIVVCLVLLSLSCVVSAEGILSALNFKDYICKEREYMLTVTKKTICMLCKFELSCLLPTLSSTATTPPASSNTANSGNQGSATKQASSSNKGGSSNQGGSSKPGGSSNQSKKPSPRGRRANDEMDNEESTMNQDNN